MSIVRRFKISHLTGAWKADDKMIYDEVYNILNNLKEVEYPRKYSYFYDIDQKFYFSKINNTIYFSNPLKHLCEYLKDDEYVELIYVICIPFIMEKFINCKNLSKI